jgi:hypothetical protein
VRWRSLRFALTMSKSRKALYEVHKLSIQVVTVIEISDLVKTELLDIMGRLGIVSAKRRLRQRAESYNKLGSIKHWGMDWRKAYPEIRLFRTPESLGLPSKLMEWTVNDIAKCILAQQAANGYRQSTRSRNSSVTLHAVTTGNPAIDTQSPIPLSHSAT